jgi:hypothetical protein
VHSFADIRGWGKQKGDDLVKGDDPQNEWRWAWLDGRSLPSSSDVTEWEECISWTRELLDDEGQRRALWAWAFSKVGGRAFKRWCFDTEKVHPVTGGRRRKRAIEVISAKLARDGSMHDEIRLPGVLPVTPKIGDVSATVEDEAGLRKDPNYWAPDAAFKSFLAVYEHSKDGGVKQSLEPMSLADRQNELRRQREARRKAA